MRSYVVDASVAAKWFVPENHTDAALRFLDDAHDLLAPDLLGPEIGNILWKKMRLGEIRKTEALQILRALSALPLRLCPSLPLLELALEIASVAQRSVYDCLYVALAVVHECQMVTADRKLYDSLKKGPFPLNLLWVEDPM